jgi:hypothetical protein
LEYWFTGSCFFANKENKWESICHAKYRVLPRSALENNSNKCPYSWQIFGQWEHEYNASIKMDLTPDKLRKPFTTYWSCLKDLKYDIDEYNCTDFALMFSILQEYPI